MAHAEPDYGTARHSQVLGTSGSIAAHLIVVALVMFGLAQTSREGQTKLVQVEHFNLEFFNRPGPMRGGGAGTGSASTLAPRVEIPVQNRREFTPAVNPAHVP